MPAHYRNLVKYLGISGLRAGAKPEPSMLKYVYVALAFLALTSTASEARSFRTMSQAPGCNVTMPCDFSTSQTNQSFVQAQQHRRVLQQSRLDYGRQDVAQGDVASARTVSGRRPSGCPRSFCGCGASLRVFGRIVPELNLAANWLRFPRTAPAPGMVAARHGHVFVLEQHVAGDTWMAYDANSGGHTTRIHARSLRGYTVVNPRAA
ncbi:hypothetical protein SAMN05444171_2493 [Bradyrhizobium lablabi]|uniref:Peptidase C51 domain-containing protein n=3 Tax=Nitrobacteraceae TaxID=41294 RepID=A0ABY0PYE8_9BRAD|nr:hypothetical protein SAMN05444163_4669 [Bradyrhizobium ottawaense]SEC88311.1 hypothetical protein SAMN05444171_2493 [Bradyrhizobium lablabi]SHK97055.1 hypothetical protein SAMN05444321_1317 [Bradyrhizobium lablabi]